jgi:signal transduction histidine kinase
MKPKVQHVISILLGLTTIAVLGVFSQSEVYSPQTDPVLWGIFTALIVLTTAFGIPLGGGEVSIMPMIALSGALVLGIIPAAWAVVCGDALYGLVRFLWPEQTGWPRDQRNLTLVGTTSANITMHGLSVLAAGSIYIEFSGQIPAPTWELRLILYSFGAAYIITNYLTASLFLWMRGRVHLTYLWKHFPRLLVYEAVPLIFVPLTAQIILLQGLTQFILFALCLMLISFILRDQANSHKDLQRRVQELGSLQAVGQALSASLDIKTITEAIYAEVSKLMPANNFYVALYNPGTHEVTFPIVYEHNVRLEWEPREMGKGLTEYVLETRQPLLIQKNVKETVLSLGYQHRGQEALSWLGVPILAGDQALGMIAVQSYPQADRIEESFDQSHLEVLSTIAAQASVAIQNAQLYTQTDHALALRVQELSSILSTIHEGILLLDENLMVVEANRSLADILDEPLSKINQLSLEDTRFSRRLGFHEDQASAILQEMRARKIGIHRETVSINNTLDKTYERVISPVVGEDDIISGWLIAFRDLTEEIHLAQLREDLTRMLVHDLRSPMVTIQGGLDMIEIMIKGGENQAEQLEMLDISRRGGEQMLGMINELLSIHKYESGQLVLNLEPVSLTDLCSEVILSFSSTFKQVNLTSVTNFAPGLPVMVLDRELIRRLTHNLIDNATKFTEDGGTIETWAKPDPDDPKMILFGVKDDGIGIAPDIQAKLFQKYFSSGDKKSRRKGTGIGLYFSKLAVEAHGGEIWVESEPGKGSNFIIRLPVEAKPQA